jgi:hypothetical protein
MLIATEAIWRTFGSEGIRRRVRFEVRKRLSLLRAQPPSTPQHVLADPPPAVWPFRPNADRLCQGPTVEEAISRANRVLAGEHQAYRATWRHRPLAAEEWNTDPETRYRYDSAAPWFRIDHGIPGTDIKDVWEPARFAWAYDLVRGWIITRDNRYAEEFWRGFESFRAGCPPYRGVQWACGQETAIRAVAWLWAEASLGDAPASTPARKFALRESLWWSGHRIADALGYALSQRNNHGISECTGLLAIGARFRAVDHDAAAWWLRAQRDLVHQVMDQFARDGWYSQHSFTYLRLALDQLVHAQRVLLAGGGGLTSEARERITSAVELLITVMDDGTGYVPNHGANDGAFVLPLTTREFRDFRPSLTAAAATFAVPLPVGITGDAETLAWLDSSLSEPTIRKRSRVVFGESGWIDARVNGTRVFARAGSYRNRPSHIDPLHLDVTINGQPVAVDAGTYRYAGSLWRALAEEGAHNTVAIMGAPIAWRGPRFLWLSWPRAAISAVSDDDEGVTIEMSNHSWRRTGITHRRICHLESDAVTVLDEVRVRRAHPVHVALHWLVDGNPADVLVFASVPAQHAEQRGNEASPYGWIAESYAVRRPATSVRITTVEPTSLVRFASGFGTARNEEHLRAILAGRLLAVRGQPGLNRVAVG